MPYTFALFYFWNATCLHILGDWGHNYNHAPFSPPVKQSRDWRRYADISPEQEYSAKPTQQSNIELEEPSQKELSWHQDSENASTNSKRQRWVNLQLVFKRWHI